jgi:hypothetical protein
MSKYGSLQIGGWKSFYTLRSLGELPILVFSTDRQLTRTEEPTDE